MDHALSCTLEYVQPTLCRALVNVESGKKKNCPAHYEIDVPLASLVIYVAPLSTRNFEADVALAATYESGRRAFMNDCP